MRGFYQGFGGNTTIRTAMPGGVEVLASWFALPTADA